MKRKLLAAFSLLLCLFLAACSESWQERADREKDLADAAYNDGYEDGYNYGYERGYEDGLAAANVPTYQENEQKAADNLTHALEVIGAVDVEDVDNVCESFDTVMDDIHDALAWLEKDS